MMHPASTTRPKRCVSGKSESVTKGRGNIGIRCPPRKADWEFRETVCSNKLVDQRSKLAIPCRRIDLDCSAANSEFSGQGCAPKGRSQKSLESSDAP